MFSKINQVQRQYMYAVQPVKLFEADNKQAQKNSLNPFSDKTNFSQYTLLHPNVSNSSTGAKLDLMG